MKTGGKIAPLLSKEKNFNKYGISTDIVAFNYLIDVAKLVRLSDPEIEFHIYGESPYRENIIELIKSNSLQETVKLFDYTTTSFETLKEFKSVVSTSQSEAQELSKLEVMLVAKSVIAFDIKYEPSEFIFNV